MKSLNFDIEVPTGQDTLLAQLLYLQAVVEELKLVN